MKNKEPKLKIAFEDGEPRKEEQIKFMFQILDLIVDGYQDVLYKGNVTI